jgi:DNA-binding MarR family transcriptional regulator
MSMTGRRRVPTRDELSTWRAFIETSSIAGARVGAELQRSSGLSSGDYRVLLALSEAPEVRMRSSELAAHIEWERSRLSAHLGRMEKRDLVRRDPCPDDARGSFVVLTDAGSTAFRASTRGHLQVVASVFVDAFDPEQLAELRGALAALRAHLGLPPLP